MRPRATSFAKSFLLVTLTLSILLGRYYYLLLFLGTLYFILYRTTLRKLVGSIKVSVFPQTVHQGDKISIDFECSVTCPMPVQVFETFKLPPYIVHSRGDIRHQILGRRIKENVSLICVGNRRGIYEVGEVFLGISDPLGFFSIGLSLKDTKKIYVFPFLVPLEKLRIRLTDPVEGMKAKYRNNKDYTYIAGVRDYVNGDPVSLIHWKQTAHRGKLSIKELDFTASKRIVIAINSYGKNQKFLDYASGIAASIAYYALKHHLPFGLTFNSENTKYAMLKSTEYHLYEIFKDLSSFGEKARPTAEFVSLLPSLAQFGSELFYIDRDVDRNIMLSLMKVRAHFGRLNIVLLPDNVFVLPGEKPPLYYFKETEYFRLLKNSIESLSREGINVYPILGKDYLDILGV